MSDGSVGVEALKREREWEFLGRGETQSEVEEEGEEREVFGPLVAFTTRVQIIEGHGNLSDR